MANEILVAHHEHLRCGPNEFVRLCIMFAYRDDNSDDPPVKLHGYPAAAVISIIPYKQRVDKRADAEIIIDQHAWGELDERKQRALLDHEITHLQFQTDPETNAVKTDEAGRPKLTMRLHDWQLGGFKTIAEHYGDDALEVINARQFQKAYGDVALEKKPAQLFAGAL